jgi:hypothetical protein
MRTFSIIVVWLIFLSGCCSPLQPIPEGVEVVPLTQHPLFPLETGRFWVYRLYIYRYDQYDRLRSIDSNDYSKIILCDTLIKHNNKFYKAILFNTDRDLPCWSNSNQVGYFTKLSISGDTTYFWRFLQYPIQKGDTFWIQRALAPFERIMIFNQPIVCVTTDEDVRVPAGNFKCYGYSFEPRTFDGHGVTSSVYLDYYALGIGKVMTIQLSDNYKKQLYAKTVLIRYGSFRTPTSNSTP